MPFRTLYAPVEYLFIIPHHALQQVASGIYREERGIYLIDCYRREKPSRIESICMSSAVWYDNCRGFERRIVAHPIQRSSSAKSPGAGTLGGAPGSIHDYHTKRVPFYHLARGRLYRPVARRDTRSHHDSHPVGDYSLLDPGRASNSISVYLCQPGRCSQGTFFREHQRLCCTSITASSGRFLIHLADVYRADRH